VSTIVCARVGCGRDATRHAVLLMWAKGHSKYSHPPIEATLGLNLCDTCEIDDELKASVHEMATTMARKLGRADPGVAEVVYPKGRAYPAMEGK